MKIDLSGKVALITGATGELGRVISRSHATCGADLAIHYHQNRIAAAIGLAPTVRIVTCGAIDL